MIKKSFTLIIFLFVTITFGQKKSFNNFEVTSGMGIQMAYTPVLTNYVNNNYGYNSPLKTFNNGVETWIEVNTDYSKDFQLGIEFAYNYFSYTNVLGSGLVYELDKTIYMPTLLGYYIIEGEGYEFKFGVGLGYRYAEIAEKTYTSDSYSAGGFGSLMRSQALTALGNNLYVNLSGDLRYDIIGTPKNGDNKIYDNVLQQNVTLNSFSVVVRVGITYIF
jgi:hypothetical protein